MLRTLSHIAILLLFPALLQARPVEVARQVMADLFEAAGYYRFSAPEVRISQRNDRVAAYYPGRNTILLDQQAYDICTSFGSDSLNALAFVLGHELAHSFQVEIRNGKAPTNFLSYDRHFSSSIRLEKAADIQGVFNAYLAGYKVYDLVPQILDRIYEQYALKGIVLRGYPPLDERKATARETMQVVRDLIQLFEASNYLTMAGQYYLASGALEYMLQYYQGREVYNNLGILYVLNALDLFDPQTDRFFYPFELEWKTFLDRDVAGRGQETLPDFQKKLRQELLEKAVFYFAESMQMDPAFGPARINRINALLLLKRPREAQALFREYYPERRIARLRDQRQSLEALTLGLIYYLREEEDLKADARRIMEYLEENGQGLSSRLARHNLAEMSGGIRPDRRPVRLAAYELPEELRDVAGSLRLPDMTDARTLLLSEPSGLFALYKEEGNNLSWSFRDDKGALISFSAFNPGKFNFSLADFNREQAPELANLISSPGGYFVTTPDGRLILRISENGKVLRAVKVYYHR